MTPTSRLWATSTLLLGSGACALVYQIGWLREFRLIFGASTAASAAVLAIFIGGLGLGGWLLGPRADRHPRPLLFYSTLEIIVALAAAATPLLFDLVRSLYIATGGTETIGVAAATGGRLVLSALVLSVPTIAMGGTLPAVARAVTVAGDVGRRSVAVLYALNTLGAVAGCLLATFVLLEALGTRQTLWLAAAVNLLIAMCARVLDRATPSVEADTLPQSPAGESGAEDATAAPRVASLPFLLTASAAIGFAFFLLELVWYRLLAPLLGGSVFTFGLVLAVALLGVGIGGLIYAMVSANRPATLAAFATTCLLEGAAVAATYALGDGVAILALALSSLRGVGFVGQVAGWSLVTAVVVLPPAIVAGYQFPLLLALFGRGREGVGQQIGSAYAANTAGAIAGSLAGGFGLLPWLSATGAWQLVAVMLLALGGWAVVASMRVDRRLFLPQMMTAGLLVGCLMSAGPTATWRHAGIGAGRAPEGVLASTNELKSWTRQMNRWVLWERDGVESGVALVRAKEGFSFIVNGKSDGSARADAGTQVMLGLLGAIRHPHPTRSLVIGLGTGSSAGWLAKVPSMSRVDVVELEPVVLEVARANGDVNQNVLDLPNVRVLLGDAREVLLASSEQYDVIASEPSNPYRAGIASLFTQEYYRAAARRLSSDGVFVQWVQSYDIDARTLRTIYATLASVFPEVETWQTTGQDLVLVARQRPFAQTSSDLAARLAGEPYRSAIAHSWRALDLTTFLSHHLADGALTRAIARTPGVAINTDDRNVVEFGLARAVGRGAMRHVPAIREMASRLGTWRGPVSDPERISWNAVETAWYELGEGAGSPPAPAEEEARRAAYRLYVTSGDVARTKDQWPAGAQPRSFSELAMMADVHASLGLDDASSLIAQLRPHQATEADIFETALLIKRGRLDEATVRLEAALTQLRTDPWPIIRYKERALMLAETLARSDRGRARRLLGHLQQPFALSALDDARLFMAAALAESIGDGSACRNAINAMGPHTPWNADFLRVRRDCYLRAGDQRAKEAERDVAMFAVGQGLPLQAIVPLVAQ